MDEIGNYPDMAYNVGWSTHCFAQTMPASEAGRVDRIKKAAAAYRCLAENMEAAAPLAKNLLLAMQEMVRRMPGDSRHLLDCIQGNLNSLEHDFHTGYDA